MKQNWEIKKLGEVCEIVGGSTPKTNEASYWDGNHYWVTPAELNGSKYISSTNRTITDEGVKSAHLQLLPLGTVLLSSRAPIGKVAITTTPMYCNQGFKNLVCTEKLNNEFAYWFLFHNTEYLNSLGSGATFKEISKRVVEQIPIPIPPLVEQEKIVAELDCLSGVIEKKKQQLKELDALAESIFYTMFGDPNTNNKSLPLCKFSTMCDNLDSKRKPITAKDRIEGNIPYYGASGIVDYVQGFIFDGDYLLVSEDGANLEVRHTPIAFSITGKTWVNNHAHILKFDNYCSQIFMKYYINLLDISDFITGCAQPKLTQANLNNIDIFNVPLPLQQEFADKIEAIEKQKELIKKSITETETLFNARMQYYFG